MKKAFVALLSIFLMISSSAQVFAENKSIRWRLAETWSAELPVFGDVAKRMADNVEKMSNGRLIISIDSQETHKAPFGIFDFVKSGQYQMGHSASHYWKGKDINTMFFYDSALRYDRSRAIWLVLLRWRSGTR